MATKKTLRSVVNAYYAAAAKEYVAGQKQRRATSTLNDATAAKERAGKALGEFVKYHIGAPRYIAVGESGLIIVAADGTVSERSLTKV